MDERGVVVGFVDEASIGHEREACEMQSGGTIAMRYNTVKTDKNGLGGFGGGRQNSEPEMGRE